jgi:hypothetical protein
VPSIIWFGMTKITFTQKFTECSFAIAVLHDISYLQFYMTFHIYVLKKFYIHTLIILKQLTLVVKIQEHVTCKFYGKEAPIICIILKFWKGPNFNWIYNIDSLNLFFLKPCVCKYCVIRHVIYNVYKSYTLLIYPLMWKARAKY